MNQKHSTCLRVSLLLAAMIARLEQAAVSEQFGLTITIHVYNYAAMPEKRGKSKGGSRSDLQKCGSDSSVGGPRTDCR